MSSTRYIRLAAIVALAAGGLHAQSVLVSVQAASSKVLVNGTAQVSAAITAIDGTPLDSGTLAWSSSDSTITNVSATGLVTGLTPGDVQIGVTDSNTGVAASLQLHVVPSSLTLQVSTTAFAVGGTAQLTPSALDAAGKAIPNLRFQFRSGQSSVATVSSDGVVTGIAEGQVSIEAGIAGVASNPALVAVTQLRILPKPRYKIRKIISTDVATDTTIAAVSTLSAANSSEVGAIVTLGNGGQAAVLLEGTKHSGSLSSRAAPPRHGPAGAANRRPPQHAAMSPCSSSTRRNGAPPASYFPTASPKSNWGSANCNNGLPAQPRRRRQRPLPHERSDPAASAVSPARHAFPLATQPTLAERCAASTISPRRGAFIVGGIADFRRKPVTSGRMARRHAGLPPGDPVRNAPSFSIDVCRQRCRVFYARANLNRFEALFSWVPPASQTLIVPRPCHR